MQHTLNFSCVEIFFFLNGNAVPLGTSLRVIITVVIMMELLEVMEYWKALETVNNSFCFP